ncbi:Uncharacterised protein [Vibrio cholerae]|nr:Uncharacterised protein [Vibrio cholerae]
MQSIVRHTKFASMPKVDYMKQVNHGSVGSLKVASL